MAENSITTPGSAEDGETPAKLSAPKDRACPYCHIHFTSSSLGRHLDLYIKDKNPKPADGIHNVEEIRQSRGNITRRQARASLAKREGSTPTSVKPSRQSEAASPTVSARYANGGTGSLLINRPDWTSTGVINDLSAPSRNVRYDTNRDSLRRLPTKVDIAQRKKIIEETQRGRAAELALVEVLDSIKAASIRAHPPAFFDFDFLSQSFPALCLRMLARPPSIGSTPVLPSSRSWPVAIPGQAHLEVLQQRLKERLSAWRQEMNMVRTRRLSDGSLASVEALDTEDMERPDMQYRAHLSVAFGTWNRLPEKDKQETWHLESLRAFAREQQDHEATKRRMRQLEIELAHAAAENKRLVECQMPREFLIHAANQLPITRETATRVTAKFRNTLNADTLIAKWIPRVQMTRNTQQPLPDEGFITPGSSTRLNGESPYMQQPSNGNMGGMDGDDEDMDAAGEEDDELAAQGQHADGLDRGVIDPSLRDQGQGDTPMQGIGMNDVDYANGKLLAEMKRYGANGR